MENLKFIVEALKSQSKNEKKKVAAILVRDGRIVATGVNGYLNKGEDKMVDHHGNDIAAVHAEMNILCFCAKNGIRVEGCDMIVSDFPCSQCSKHLHQAGINNIYYLEDYKNDDNFYEKYLNIKKL
jgi:dCMP deaminase